MSNNNQNGKSRFPTPRNSNQNNQQTPSRFGGSSRFGSKSKSGSRFGSNTSSRFGSSSSRFAPANQAIKWSVSPLMPSAVRISLSGLGDPLHRLLGTPLDQNLSAPGKISELLAKNADLKQQLTGVLDDAWSTYGFRGAALLYPWEDNVRRAFMDDLQPVTPPPPSDDKSDDDAEEYIDYEDELDAPAWTPDATKSKLGIQTLRAIDIAFVMNVLVRARANMIVATTPLALEPGFLEKTVICDDDRIVKLARATGCIDETW